MKNSVLRDSILSRLRQMPGKIGFYYKNLTTGEELSYQDQMPMMAASVIKLFIMAEAYRQIHEGRLSKDQMVTIHKADCVPSCGALTYMHEGLQVTVEDLYTLMIILSDNSATNFLVIPYWTCNPLEITVISLFNPIILATIHHTIDKTFE